MCLWRAKHNKPGLRQTDPVAGTCNRSILDRLMLIDVSGSGRSAARITLLNINPVSHLQCAVKDRGSTDARWLQTAWGAARSPLTFGLRLWVSVCLSLYVAFWLELDNPFWAGTTAALVCQPHLGASLRKGWFRMTGGAGIVVLTICFPQEPVLFLTALALWGAIVPDPYVGSGSCREE